MTTTIAHPLTSPVLAPYSKTILSLNTIQAEMNATFIDRADMVQSLMTALVSSSTIFVLGEPGLAKSDLLKNLGSRITSNEVNIIPFYHRTIDGKTMPEDVFAPLDIMAFKQGRHCYNPINRAAAARVVLNDEIWRGTQLYRDSLLEAINDRRLSLGPQTFENLPMVLFCCASNTGPKNNDDAAFFDRLMFRLVVKPLEGNDFVAYLNGMADGSLKSKSATTIEYMELAALQAFIRVPSNVSIPSNIIDALVKIKIDLGEKGITCSDRRWGQILNVIKSMAVLRGSVVVDFQDLKILKHILWQEQEQIRDVSRIVLRIAAPVELVLQEKLEIVQELHNEGIKAAKLPLGTERTTKIIGFIRQIETVITDVSDLKNSSTQFDDLYDSALQVMKKQFEELSDHLVGSKIRGKK